jgi:hypothetical protein
MGWTKARGGLCPICRRAIERGDGLRWIRPDRFSPATPVHSSCFEKDWEFLEVGLEPALRLATEAVEGSRSAIQPAVKPFAQPFEF